jgi:predicted nucleic acid-binding protein
VKPIFADTSFYAASLMPRDSYHAMAVEVTKKNRDTILTTEFVIIELLNFFSKSPGRNIVAEFVRSLRSDPDTIVVPASSELIERGFELFSQRADKEWSLTDCISFVVMDERGIASALTSDAHFEQAGFTKLLA